MFVDMDLVAFVVFWSDQRIFVFYENFSASEVDSRLKELLVAISDMRVGSKKHQDSSFDCLVQSEHKFTKVFVALVKIFVVEIELELVALIVIAYNRCEYLTLSNKVFTNQLNPEIGVKIVL